MAMKRISALLGLYSSSSLQQLRQMPVILRRSYNAAIPNNKTSQGNPENESLLGNLATMGVDLKMARRRQPGVLRKVLTNEIGLARFLQSKGANREMIASIISRYPRAITRSSEHLEERWGLWWSIFKSNKEIVSILHRSPESFFRSSDNENLEKNIMFLSSLGINPRDLRRLLTTAPRTFSNSLELNRQMVELLQDVCVSLGGENPEQFVKAVISRNLYILIRSTKRIRANIDFLRTSLNISDAELLTLLQGHGAEIIDVSHESLKRNFKKLQEKLLSLGCNNTDVKRLILSYSSVLFGSPSTLSNKLDCLMKGGITIKQILDKPKVLDFSISTMKHRLNELHRVAYDFKNNGIAILDTSHKRFEAKLEKLNYEE
ncbi:transcription termination factor 1, mitochondrial [Chanos chanos]|uniref:Transcription termination factor 1, mitochondrial n=1 Tax=Chanos chanos TaxID=29144 RepID=A0A6J2WL38_CHACN|nr:transcription termination factor 1, mitochondrial [Chanos chanos]